jgi:RimJ/RimL family protein N-acetyltransferase
MVLRVLEGERSDMALLQDLLETAEDYFNATTGYPPGRAECQTLYSSLPEGKAFEDKFLYGLFDGNTLAGCVDIIRDYPRSSVAEIGVFIVRYSLRRRGYGRTAMKILETHASQWPGVTRLRCELPIVLPSGIAFLHAVGFAATGERRPYDYSHVHTEQVAYEKLLRRA